MIIKYEAVAFDVLEAYNQVVVYSEHPKVMEVLKKLFPNLKSKHATSLLTAPLTQFSMGTPKKQLFVHMRDGAFDLFLFQGAQLLFFNSFKQADKKIGEYYEPITLKAASKRGISYKLPE